MLGWGAAADDELAVVEHVTRPGDVHGDPEVGNELMPLSGQAMCMVTLKSATSCCRVSCCRCRATVLSFSVFGRLAVQKAGYRLLYCNSHCSISSRDTDAGAFACFEITATASRSTGKNKKMPYVATPARAAHRRGPKSAQMPLRMRKQGC